MPQGGEEVARHVSLRVVTSRVRFLGGMRGEHMCTGWSRKVTWENLCSGSRYIAVYCTRSWPQDHKILGILVRLGDERERETDPDEDERGPAKYVIIRHTSYDIRHTRHIRHTTHDG